MSQKGFYIQSLDGLRAVAVMLVFTGHAGLGQFVPGGLGVTIFFFLSGYLITTLMRLEFEKTGRLSFSKFYLRRVYRIFPPFYLVMALVLVLALIGMLPSELTPAAVLAQALQITNYYLIFANPEQTLPGLTVLWSLSVEEHFYLIFPMLFIFLARKLDRTAMAGVIALICLAVLSWRLYLVFGLHVPQIRTYYATDTRIDSIMFGCIMALWKNPVLDPLVFKGKAASLAILAVAGAVLLFCLLYRDPGFRETWRYSLQGLALFPVFYMAITKHDWPLFSWLNWAPVRYMGKVSYTAYLIHPTAIALSMKLLPNAPVLVFVSGFMLTLGFSALMYHFVERHMSTLRARLHQ
jgi:peptidoglycan/LPS O-acetylase OafA/YrhL